MKALLLFVFISFASQVSAKTDLVIFSYDRPLQLHACLESIYQHVSNVDQIVIIYRSSEKGFSSAYEKVKQDFPGTCWYLQSHQAENDFKNLVLNAVYNNKANYVAFVVDDIIIKDAIDLAECETYLQMTGAYGFHLRLGHHLNFCYSCNSFQAVPPNLHVDKEIYSWKFSQGSFDWKYPNCLDMTVYNKQEIEADLRLISFQNPNTFEGAWMRLAKFDKIGLFYSSSKLVNIPLNVVSTFKNRQMNLFSKQVLLEKYNAGLKIDIRPLYQIQNCSAHIEYEPSFINRYPSNL
jgi:hypothetical protein